MLVLALVAVAVGLVAAIAVATPALVDQSRADAVADVAALAGVSGGPEAARIVARRAAATAVRVETGSDGSVQVEVVLAGRSGLATAAQMGPEWPEDPVGAP